MKKVYNTIKLVAGAIILAMTAVSCIPETQSMGDAGQTLIKLMPSDGFAVVALNPTSASQTLPLLEVRRDVNSGAALNTSTTVELIFDADTAILNAYNDDNGTEFIPLPPALHSTTPALTGGKISVTFGPGEAVKTITITVPNAFNFDFSKQYALTYSIGTVSGTGIVSEAATKEIVCQVLAKNKYDGIYVVTANSPMVDVANSNLTGYYPFKYKLITTGEHTVDCFEFDNDYPLHPLLNGTNWSYYGSFCPQLQFKTDGSGEIIGMTNYFGNPAGNTRSVVMDTSEKWYWNTTTKNIRLKYIMKQPSVITTPPNYRVFFDETWTYQGPR